MEMTYEKALKITKQTDAFYVKYDEVEGQKVAIFNYRFATYQDFEKYNAFALRGLTFVQWSNGTWKKFSLLNKFFNINETEVTQVNKLLSKEIVNIAPKEDGSIISFVMFENGKIRAKSKASFTSEQAILAQKLFEEDECLQNNIQYSLMCNETIIFELVGPDNRIVLDHYTSNHLIPLVTVDSNSGDIIKFHTNNISYSLEDIINLQETEENIEGWVITFKNNFVVKAKTNWYFDKHKLIGPDAFAEHNIIEKIVNAQIDDMLSALNIDSDKHKEVMKIVNTIDHFMNSIIEIVKSFEGKITNRKTFAMKYKSEVWFPFVMNCYSKNNWSEENIEELIKSYVLKRCRKLEIAKDFITELGE
jgi:RNA ligase